MPRHFRLVLHVEIDREDDGRWIADVPEIPGVMVYGSTQAEAVGKAKALALQVIGERLSRGENPLTGHHLEEPFPPEEYIDAFDGIDFSPVELAY